MNYYETTTIIRQTKQLNLLYGHLNPDTEFKCKKWWVSCRGLSDCKELVGVLTEDDRT